MDAPLDGDWRTTLIVEDDLSTRELLTELLSLDGVPAIAVGTVGEARTLLTARAFACAVIDKNLPDGSGLDVLRALREHGPETEAVLLTATADLSSAVEALRLGASDYLFKPVDPTLFRKRLASLLDRRRVRDENRRLQSRLLRSERAGSIGVLAAALAHELNTPLAYVTANLNFLRERLQELSAAVPALGELLEVVDESREGAERMKATVDQVRLLEQGYREEMGPVDVQETLSLALELVLPLAPRASTLRRELHPVPKVNATRAQLLQVFLEVITLASGSEQQPAAEVQVTLTSDDQSVVVTVSATPAPPDFAAFNGTGTLLSAGHPGRRLGVSVCRGIIHSLGGQCALDGPGHTLRIRFPIAPGGLFRDVLDPSAPVGEPR